jgi:hypothetical protein
MRINASDLPDALSEIFFAEWLDTPQLQGDLICPSGNQAGSPHLVCRRSSEDGQRERDAT